MPVQIPKDSWPGSVRTMTIGATAADGGTRTRTITVGGEKALPFMHFEAEMPHKPVIALEIKDRKPDDWSPLLLETWGEAMETPGAWAKAAEAAGADLLQIIVELDGCRWQSDHAGYGGNGRPISLQLFRPAAPGLWAGTS